MQTAQVATREAVLIFDLPALEQSASFRDLLARVLGSPHVIKLGCGLHDDLASLARALPSLPLGERRNLLDLQRPFLEWQVFASTPSLPPLPFSRRACLPRSVPPFLSPCPSPSLHPSLPSVIPYSPSSLSP